MATGLYDGAKQKDGIRIRPRRIAADATLWQQHFTAAHQQHLTHCGDPVLLLDLLLQVLDAGETEMMNIR